MVLGHFKVPHTGLIIIVFDETTQYCIKYILAKVAIYCLKSITKYNWFINISIFNTSIVILIKILPFIVGGGLAKENTIFSAILSCSCESAL